MKIFVLPLILTVLAGCADRYALDNRGPDAYSVTAKPPLSLPPDFTLRAPVPAKKSPLPETPDAEKILTQDSGVSKSTDKNKSETQKEEKSELSESEKELLKQAPDSDAANIREQLEKDAKTEDDDSLYLERKIKEWQEEDAENLNAEKEAERLKQKGIKTTGAVK